MRRPTPRRAPRSGGRRSCAARRRRRRARARRPRLSSAASKAAFSSGVMFWSSPACSARIGAAISSASCGRPGLAVALARPAVEADRAGEAVAGGGREPRVAAAEAEADGEDRRRRRPRAAARRRRATSAWMPSWVVCGDVLRVREVVVALADAGRAAEVVDRDRRVPALGEAQRELLVEAVEAAHVGQHDDARRGRLLGRGRERGEAVAVGRLEHEILVRDRRAARRPGSAAASRARSTCADPTQAAVGSPAWRCSNRASSARTSSSGGARGCRRSSTSSARGRPRSRAAAASARSSAIARAASCSRASAIDRLRRPRHGVPRARRARRVGALRRRGAVGRHRHRHRRRSRAASASSSRTTRP